MNNNKLKELTQKQKEIIQQTYAQYIGLKKDSDAFIKEVSMSFIEKITQEQINK